MYVRVCGGKKISLSEEELGDLCAFIGRVRVREYPALSRLKVKRNVRHIQVGQTTITLYYTCFNER